MITPEGNWTVCRIARAGWGVLLEDGEWRRKNAGRLRKDIGRQTKEGYRDAELSGRR
jgi:hypothetical protein